MRGRRSFGINPARLVGLAVIVVVAIFEYSRWTRPDVPVLVQRVLQKYTGPAVAVGVTVGEVRKRLGVPLTVVPHLGFVAHVGDSTGISQLRLWVRPRNGAARPNDSDRVDAVEILTASPDAFTTLAVDLTAFFRDAPREGCLKSPRPGNFREVRYWMASGSRGGIAFTNDFGANASVDHPGMVVVGLLAFTGPFRGGETMHGDYAPQPCAVLAGLAR
jgi:hypothetical protein